MMNERQQKQYDKISKFLEQFGAKIKDGEEYKQWNSKIIIVNKNNIEKIIEPYVIKRLLNSEFWNLGSGMSKTQQKIYDNINNFLTQFGGKIKEGEKYTISESKIKIVNKYNIEKEIIANNIRRMTDKNDFWSFDGKSDERQKNHLEMARKIAQERGGELISEEYINSITKLKLRDKLGNFFMMSFNSLLSGKWSPYEAKRAKDPEYHLEELIKIAESKGGKLLSTEYKGAKNKLKFADSQGREFWSRSDQIKEGNWSPFERGLGFNNEYYINELKEIAEKRGGKIISTQYINSRTKLEFEDRNGERFWATAHSIKKGVWSPFEGLGISEEITRQCLEYIFEQKFIKTRSILTRNGKQPLELDGYNQILNIAFEYQGEQHYDVKSIISFVKNKDEVFKRIQKNDKEKIDLCNKKNIILIAIKYFPKKLKENEYFKYILDEIQNHKDYLILEKYIKNINSNNFIINYTKIPNSNDKIIEIEKLAKNKGGKLISKKYINNQTKLEFENEKGIRFFKTYSQILKGGWYKESRRYGEEYYIKRITKLAKIKGGKLISTKCENRNSILELEDANNNRFFRTYNALIQKLWSPFENEIIIEPNYYLNKAKEIAESKGGKLLSTEYVNVKSLLEFEDDEGRKFKKSYKSIINGVWTPFVNKKKKGVDFYLQRMKKIAESKGGILLSDNCENINSVLKFKDAQNNIFEEQYFKVTKGAWSPFEKKMTLKRKKAINNLKHILQLKDAELLSKEDDYINSRTKLEIKTREGIQIFRSLDELKRGRWLRFYKK